MKYYKDKDYPIIYRVDKHNIVWQRILKDRSYTWLSKGYLPLKKFLIEINEQEAFIELL